MSMENINFTNPFRPGAGHMPPYLAGREDNKEQFEKLLQQDVILKNLILTGLRGVGKTVLLETLKPIAIRDGWLWVGTELSESVSIGEEHLATRLLADLSLVTSGITQKVVEKKSGFTDTTKDVVWNYGKLTQIYTETPGLHSDKLKAVLESVWSIVLQLGKKGIVFAYDEAQNLADNPKKDRYPLSLLLDVFQSLQRKGIMFMLALTGLPTIQSRLVEARTYSERMFQVIFLDRLSPDETRQAIEIPIRENNCPFPFSEPSLETVCKVSGGYPYFVQFICKEAYDRWVQQHVTEGALSSIPVDEIIRKLDADFFAGRWARVTDRQRDLLRVIAQMDKGDSEFTVSEIVNASQHHLLNPFAANRVSAILATLIEIGLVFRNRHGKYRFAVPMFGDFILRHLQDGPDLFWT
jgi:hypothetical protein